MTGVLPLISICTVSGVMILWSKGKAAKPLIHRNELPAGISGPQLLSRYAVLHNAVDIMMPVPWNFLSSCEDVI